MFKWKFPRLPDLATAPFCPSEVVGTIQVAENQPYWKKLLQFVGPGILISVGYMDPGNWATDIEAGSKFGFNLLFVVLLSSLAAIVLQYLSLKLGIVAEKDLARLSRDRYVPAVNKTFWILAEIGIVACDLAEVLGGALAFHLLLGCSLTWGIILTAFDTIVVLGLKDRGFRQLEAIVLGLVTTIAVCFFVELVLLKPFWPDVFHGLVPSWQHMESPQAWYLSIGILGATVMPHNLYLHSSIVQTRVLGRDRASKREAIHLATFDTVFSLLAAFLINAAILILAASAFHATGRSGVVDIQDAYHLLEPIAGTVMGSILFGIALFASGQSATFTGTIAGQVIMEGFIDLKIPCWKRRVITRALALIPAFIGVALLGDASTGKLLVFSQVVLSLQLPFAILPLIQFTNDHKIMGEFKNTLFMKWLAWFLLIGITAANLWLLWQLVFV